MNRTVTRPKAPVVKRRLNGQTARPVEPVARFDVGAVGVAKRRSPVWMAAGVLIVAACALGGVLLVGARDHRSSVVVAAHDLPAGTAITKADLRVITVSADAGLSALSPTAAASLVGELPVAPVDAGTLLNPGMFAASDALGSGEMVFGASLSAGAAPLSKLQVGDRVELLTAPTATGGAAVIPADGSIPPGSVAAVSLGVGSVYRVETLATGDVWVSIRASSDVGLAASAAAASKSLRVVLVGGS